jgi:uncharacterized membrane protein (UPF0127 family)
MAVELLNERTRGRVASSVEVASTRRARRRGLLGRDHLDTAAALILEPCAAVHTAFMRFNIDVIFVDRAGYAVKIVENVPPWRMALSLRAHTVIEMAAGSVSRYHVLLGDRLYMTPETV